MADNVSLIPDSKTEQQEAIHYTHLVLENPRPNAPESPCAPSCRAAWTGGEKGCAAALFDAVVWLC